MTFGVISFHLVHEHLVTAAVVPVVYAAAMGADAVASLGTGFAYDRVGGGTLLVLPVVVAAVPALVFTDRVGLAVAGVLLWGAATGVQDSTVKALVADLVPAARLATAYGAFAAFQAVAALAGGVLAGWLYDVRPRRAGRGDRRSPRPWRWCCSSACSCAGGTAATRPTPAGLG